MATFVDRALISLVDPTTLTNLLTGGVGGPYPRLLRVVESVYSSDAVDVVDVSNVTTSAVVPVVRYDASETLALSHVASQPAYALAELRGTRRFTTDSAYADLLATLSLDVVLTRDPGGIESVAIDPIEEINSFADFESRFRYLDLDAFLAEHQISTLEELQSRYQYLLAELKFHAPTDEESTPQTVSVQVPLACVLSEDLDVLPALKAATALRASIDRIDSGRTDPVFGTPAHAVAVAVVFPEAALGAGTPTAEQVDTVCAGAQVLSLFASPP